MSRLYNGVNLGVVTRTYIRRILGDQFGEDDSAVHLQKNPELNCPFCLSCILFFFSLGSVIVLGVIGSVCCVSFNLEKLTLFTLALNLEENLSLLDDPSESSRYEACERGEEEEEETRPMLLGRDPN